MTSRSRMSAWSSATRMVDGIRKSRVAVPDSYGPGPHQRRGPRPLASILSAPPQVPRLAAKHSTTRDRRGPMTTGGVHSDDTVWVNGNAVRVPAGQWRQGATPRALLRLSGPVLPAWRERLAAEQLTLRFWCPPNGACVQMPEHWRQQAAQLASLGFIAGGCDYTETMCQRFDERHGQALPQSALPGALVDIVCFSGERDSVVAELARRGIAVLQASTSKLRVAYDG